MRAALYTGDRTFVVEERPEKGPGPGEVALDVAFTGICGTDLHIFHGAMDARVRTPAVIGHEMAGRVVGVGDGVTGWTLGAPATVIPVVSCGACPACRAGHRHVCHRLTFLGIDASGSMQARWTVPAELLLPLPSDLPLDHAALVEPTAVAVHDVRRAELEPEQRVVVVGGGPVGLLIALVARRHGADIVVVEPHPHRRAVAQRLGLATADPTHADVPALIGAWTEEAGAAVAFEVSGTQAGLELAVAVLAVRGRLVQVGIHPQPRLIDLHRFFWRELSLVGARLYDRSDFEHAIDLVAHGAIPADVLISRIEPLSGVAAAFAALEAGGDVMKVLIDCQRP